MRGTTVIDQSYLFHPIKSDAPQPLKRSLSPSQLSLFFSLYTALYIIALADLSTIAINCMAYIGGVAAEESARPGALLQPLPTLAVGPDKLDAGLRSLDHCEDRINRVECILILANQIAQNCHYGAIVFVSELSLWCGGRKLTWHACKKNGVHPLSTPGSPSLPTWELTRSL